MANIKNIDGLSPAQIRTLVNQGGKFVMYKYCVSFVIATQQRNSAIYFVKPNESEGGNKARFFFTSFFLGWWGIPWGPIYTIGGISNTLGGGTNVTSQVIASINQNDPNYGAGSGAGAYNVPGQNASASNATTPSNSGASQYNVPGQTNNNNQGNSPYNIPK